MNPDRSSGNALCDAGLPAWIPRHALGQRGNDLVDVFADPQVLHRDMYLEMPHPTLGSIKQTGLPLKFSLTPGGLDRHPPLLGEHNEGILRDLGYSDSEIERLAEKSVI